MPADERVTRSSFSDWLQPILVPTAIGVLPDRIWSDKEWERIQLGYWSRDMDEKWAVVAEGEVVFLHRSWTGYGVFEATFAPVEGGGWRIASAVVETGRGGLHGNVADYDCLMLELVISTIVLGEPADELRLKLPELTRGASRERMLRRESCNTVSPASVQGRRSRPDRSAGSKDAGLPQSGSAERASCAGGQGSRPAPVTARPARLGLPGGAASSGG
ncbi:hypothetical protein [Streptomyces sp. NPDC002133]|uniref:hypothetical protein n=1 Tax=Streptomyces sp. NPDC002133 TaxID=3154409 RepID=UPI00331A2795